MKSDKPSTTRGVRINTLSEPTHLGLAIALIVLILLGAPDTRTPIVDSATNAFRSILNLGRSDQSDTPQKAKFLFQPAIGTERINGREAQSIKYGARFDETSTDQISVEYDIELAEGGDYHQNGQIDAGDTIKFIYAIQNPTDQDYPYSVLQTQVLKENYLQTHGISGGSGLRIEDGKVEFPNLYLQNHSLTIISVNVELRYFHNDLREISTEPTLLSQEGERLFVGEKKSVSAEPITVTDMDVRLGGGYQTATFE